MDRSKLSHIIATTSLLAHFSPLNTTELKSCIFDQLGIKTESQFVCIALNSLYKSLSTKSLSIIRMKAIEISENQTFISNTNVNAKQDEQSNVTVHKHVQQQYKDHLSRLHSDIIDYFGTFLTKKQSIEFSYLNKHLFIETQKQSYLLNRCNDKSICIHDRSVDKLIFGKGDAFNYTFPRYLELAILSRDYMMEKKCHF